ncbi:mycofactocin-coupled SDR family oxidoreductase [Naumannella halotolerans]|uniref:SDR family mycofactocin-dependent oxidoreductase n=1 Tax=Naumannella halotolerans TaxID=993414 RepID=A0A4R7J7D9_9ACTN|nr:mycofactocin-coupled SDR family oxidoreductase [Naumannella halotolerans]TDT33351.1 SDR family mycofactocin-dependent oxidoreductase [Naumannella halotolerans]
MNRQPDPARVALVTGAARGIGAAAVRRLVADGLRVVAVDACLGGVHDLPGVAHPLAGAEQLEAVVAPYPDAVVAVRADVRDLDALRAAAGTALERWGRLDAVVAAAAVISGGSPLWETPAEEARALIDIDAGGVWNTAVATVPHLLRSPDPSGARFVAIASAAGDRGLFGLSAYVVAKHAVVGIVRALAADLVGTGVTATAISPGSTRTDMLSATADIYGTGIDDLAQSQLIRTTLSPEDLAAVIGLAVSPAGRALNGGIVHADGGFS